MTNWSEHWNMLYETIQIRFSLPVIWRIAVPTWICLPACLTNIQIYTRISLPVMVRSLLCRDIQRRLWRNMQTGSFMEQIWEPRRICIELLFEYSKQRTNIFMSGNNLIITGHFMVLI